MRRLHMSFCKKYLKRNIKLIKYKIKYKIIRIIFAFCNIRSKFSREQPGSRLFRIDWNVTRGSRCNGLRPTRSLSCTFLEMTSPDAAHLSSREIPCDEYLRVRLRKSKTIRFNHGEGRYETRAIPLSIFSGTNLPSSCLFPRNMLIIRRQSRFYLHRNYDTLSRVSKRRKTEIYYFPSVIYASGLIFRILRSHRDLLLLGACRAFLLLYSFAHLDTRRIYARRTMIRHALLVLGRNPRVSHRYFRDSSACHFRGSPHDSWIL